MVLRSPERVRGEINRGWGIGDYSWESKPTPSTLPPSLLPSLPPTQPSTLLRLQVVEHHLFTISTSARIVKMEQGTGTVHHFPSFTSVISKNKGLKTEVWPVYDHLQCLESAR